MRYGHCCYYWLALLAGVTGHQMLLQCTNASIAVGAGAVVIIVAAGLVLVRSPEVRSLRVAVPERLRVVHQASAAGDGD